MTTSNIIKAEPQRQIYTFAVKSWCSKEVYSAKNE